MKDITLYTTCACEDSTDDMGLGGWCGILVAGDRERIISGGEMFTNRSRMGISSVIGSLRVLNQSCSVRIITDYKPLCDAFKDNWFDGWINHGWKGKDGNPVRNEDLWKQLAVLRVIHDISVAEASSDTDKAYLSKAKKYAENIAAGHGALAQSVSAAAS